MADQNNVRPVTEAQLHRIYEEVDDQWAEMEIRRVFQETERLDAEGTEERAEGFAAGLFFGTTVAMAEGIMSPLAGMATDLESLYPEVGEATTEMGREVIEDADIDAEELIRELEGVETADEAVEWIHEREGEGPAHVSDIGPDGQNPYVLHRVDELPPGWERAEGDENEQMYLVKE